MAIKLTDTQHYSAIAAAIRAKNGTADTYTPAQMAQAITAIPTGEQAPEPVAEKAYTFYDFDGLPLFSYWADELAQLSALPTPTREHEGLTFDGWNWTLADLRSVSFAAVGACYHPTAGGTRIEVDLCGSPNTEFELANDEEDPHTFDIIINGSTTTAILNSHGTYHFTLPAAEGRYVIEIIPKDATGQYKILPPHGQNYSELLFLKYHFGEREVFYSSSQNVLQSQGYNFRPLEVVTLPAGSPITALTGTTGGAYREALKAFIFPRGLVTLSATQIMHSDNNGAARRFCLGPLVTSLPKDNFKYRRSVYEWVLPPTLTSMYFPGTYCERIVMTATTPPTLSNATCYANKVYVPDASVAAYKAATNWSTSASKIFPISDLIAELGGGA